MDPEYTSASNTGSAGVVEIATIPRMFYTPAYGAPDMLFYSILTSAREAYAATAPSGQPERSEQEIGLAASTFMTGLLLRDDNFILARVLRNCGHLYSLNFAAGTIQLRTEIFSVQQQSSSLFTVKIEGRIRENMLVVRNAVTDRVLAQISEDEIAKPNFFTHELPFLAYHAQHDPEVSQAAGAAALVDQKFELRLSLPIGTAVKSVLVQKDKGELQVQVRDAETDQVLCLLPLDSLNNLGQLVETLQNTLNTKNVKIPA